MRKVLPLVLVISVVFALVTTGCGATGGGTPPPTQPVACSLRVISSCAACWGNVYVNGIPAGVYLVANGAAVVSNVPCGQMAAVHLVDEFGWVSHTEYVQVTGPNTIVNFTYW